MRSLRTQVIGVVIIAGVLLTTLAGATNYNERAIINAIVGEASNQGYQGMLGVACAIRNRMQVPYYQSNVLRGVYGAKAKHLRNESNKVFALAEKAWVDSAMRDVVRGAYIWGTDSDIQKFKTQTWFNNMVPIVKIGDHTFFRRSK